MKNLFLYLFVVFSFRIVFAQVPYQVLLEEAFLKAKKENKLVFIKYYSEGCPHCIELQEVLEKDSVLPFLKENFISYKIEAETSPFSDFKFISKNKIFIESVPCLLFFDANKNFVHYGQPKQDVDAILKTLKTALDPIERTGNYKNKYESGERDRFFLKKYSKFAQLTKDTSIVNKIADDLYAIFPKEELLSKQSIVNTASYVKSINNGFFKFWMENYTKLDSVNPEVAINNKEKIFQDILMECILANKSKWNLNEFKQVKKYIEITKLSANKNSFFWEEETKLMFENKLEEEALQIFKEILENEKSNSYQMIYVMNYFLPKLSKKQSLKTYKKIVETYFPYIKEEALQGEIDKIKSSLEVK